ncbi:MAG: ELWxxDGT repeat protein, partial [Thermoanaerobaculia bacterium]
TSRPVAFQDGLLAVTCVPVDGGATAREELRLVQGTGSTTLVSREGEHCRFSPPVALEDAAVFGVSGDPSAIWRTDGTPEGTRVLIPGTPDRHPGEVVRFGDEAAIWFWRRHPQSNDFSSELWLTDGTPEGTRKQLDLPEGTELSGLTAAGGRLWFFDWVEGETGSRQQPWVSDGTPAGTYPLTAMLGETAGFSDLLPAFVEAGGRVWFLFREAGAESLEIWSSDGTPAGTGPAVTAASGAVEPQSLTGAQDRLYFLAARADDPRGRLRPWVSDGTDGSTVLLADVEVPDHHFAQFELPDGFRSPFVEFAGRVWFAAKDRQHGAELWSTDGTPEGTSRLLDIAPGRLGSSPRYLTAWNGRLWFAARDGVHGMEPWTSDGTAEGTRMVQDIHPGPSWSMPIELTPTSSGLFFSANDGEHGREFWLLYPF